MNKQELKDSAIALYDGGWRADDAEEIKKEYEFTNDEIEVIVGELNALEEECMQNDIEKALELHEDGVTSGNSKEYLRRYNYNYIKAERLTACLKLIEEGKEITKEEYRKVKAEEEDEC